MPLAGCIHNIPHWPSDFSSPWGLTDLLGWVSVLSFSLKNENLVSLSPSLLELLSIYFQSAREM